MREVLRDLSAPLLAQAIEANLYAFTPFSHNMPGVEVHAGWNLSWCISDIPFPWCNVVFRAHLNAEEVDTAIDDLIARGNANSVPLSWFIGKDTKPDNLDECLKSHGFIHRIDLVGMAIDLLNMYENVSVPSTLTITEVNDIRNLRIWCHTTSIGYGFPEGEEQALLNWFVKDIHLQQSLKFYLGWLEGKPVATSLLFWAEGVAGVYFVATIPEVRRQGIGFAITLKPLQEGREMGYRISILQASKMGKPVYLRMGFKEYCKIGNYIMRPGKQP